MKNASVYSHHSHARRMFRARPFSEPLFSSPALSPSWRLRSEGKAESEEAAILPPKLQFSPFDCNHYFSLKDCVNNASIHLPAIAHFTQPLVEKLSLEPDFVVSTD